MGAARQWPGDYDEQTAALRAGVESVQAGLEAELARTEESLAITRVALALRQAVLLDTELQLAQIMNYRRALGIANRANLGQVAADRGPGSESEVEVDPRPSSESEVEVDPRPTSESGGVTAATRTHAGPPRPTRDEIEAAPTTPRKTRGGVSRLLGRAVWLLLLALGIAALVVFALSRPWEGENGRVADEAPSLAGLAEATRGAPEPHHAGWKLVWHDEFDEATCPDRSKWGFERGFVRNEELQWYQPDNASCHHGVLVIEARRADKPNPNYRPETTDWRRSRPSADYTSASITSERSFTYGRFETFARIDTRQGSLPAFWTLGTALRRDPNAWPQSGEVDIMQYYRNTVLANVCKPKRGHCAWSSASQSLASLGGEEWANRFHVWAMEWSPRKIDLFLDDKLVNHVPVRALGAGDRNPYLHKPAYLLLSQAIGGENGGDPTNTTFPVRFEVDYVRVYERAHGGG